MTTDDGNFLRGDPDRRELAMSNKLRTPGTLSIEPDEAAVDLLLAALSIFLTQGMDEQSDKEHEEFRRDMQLGQLRLDITMPPLAIHVSSIVEGHERNLFTVPDRRPKWMRWALDLVERYSSNRAEGVDEKRT